MRSPFKLPLEQQAREEAVEQRITWDSGPFNFLLARTHEKYKHKATTRRRQALEKQLGIALPEITDEMLRSLYELSCFRFSQYCRSKYGFNSGFAKTPSEQSFLNTLKTIINNSPKLVHLEVYPNTGESTNFKMVVGNHVPDFLIFGLKIKGCSAVAIEIDGDSHIEKWDKDELRNAHLKELKIFTFEVPNIQATDTSYLSKAIMEMYRLRNGSFNAQIQRAKRMIWVKTISCQLSLIEIDELARKNFSINLNLVKESEAITKLNNCPRVIKGELASI